MIHPSPYYTHIICLEKVMDIMDRIAHIILTLVAKALATSLAPIPNAIKNPNMPAAIVIHRY